MNYEISNQTFIDIIEKVPQEKWSKCFEELSCLFLRYSEKSLIEPGEKLVVDLDDKNNVLTWIDDDKRGISFTNHSQESLDKI